MVHPKPIPEDLKPLRLLSVHADHRPLLHFCLHSNRDPPQLWPLGQNMALLRPNFILPNEHLDGNGVEAAHC
jgi:hypothetical protein